MFQKVGKEAVLQNPEGGDARQSERRFAFDHVYDHTSKQVEVYTEVAAPMLTKAFAGFNGTIFAFVLALAIELALFIIPVTSANLNIANHTFPWGVTTIV